MKAFKGAVNNLGQGKQPDSVPYSVLALGRVLYQSEGYSSIQRDFAKNCSSTQETGEVYRLLRCPMRGQLL